MPFPQKLRPVVGSDSLIILIMYYDLRRHRPRFMDRILLFFLFNPSDRGQWALLRHFSDRCWPIALVWRHIRFALPPLYIFVRLRIKVKIFVAFSYLTILCWVAWIIVRMLIIHHLARWILPIICSLEGFLIRQLSSFDFWISLRTAHLRSL